MWDYGEDPSGFIQIEIKAQTEASYPKIAGTWVTTATVDPSETLRQRKNNGNVVEVNLNVNVKILN